MKQIYDFFFFNVLGARAEGYVCVCVCVRGGGVSLNSCITRRNDGTTTTPLPLRRAICLAGTAVITEKL